MHEILIYLFRYLNLSLGQEFYRICDYLLNSFLSHHQLHVGLLRIQSFYLLCFIAEKNEFGNFFK